MDPIKKPTKAAIEAALSAYYGEVDAAARKNVLRSIKRSLMKSCWPRNTCKVMIGASGKCALALRYLDRLPSCLATFRRKNDQ